MKLFYCLFLFFAVSVNIYATATDGNDPCEDFVKAKDVLMMPVSNVCVIAETAAMEDLHIRHTEIAFLENVIRVVVMVFSENGSVGMLAPESEVFSLATDGIVTHDVVLTNQPRCGGVCQFGIGYLGGKVIDAAWKWAKKHPPPPRRPKPNDCVKACR